MLKSWTSHVVTRDWLALPPPPLGDKAALVNAANAFAVPTGLALNRVFRFFSLLFCPPFFPSPSPPPPSSLFGQDKLTAPGTSASFDFSERKPFLERRRRRRKRNKLYTRYKWVCKEVYIYPSFEFKLNFFRCECERFHDLNRDIETLANYRFSLIGKVDLLSR